MLFLSQGLISRKYQEFSMHFDAVTVDAQIAGCLNEAKGILQTCEEIGGASRVS